MSSPALTVATLTLDVTVGLDQVDVTVEQAPTLLLDVVAGGPAGLGDMQSLIYDPAGRSTDAFNIGNHVGVFDAGTFT